MNTTPSFTKEMAPPSARWMGMNLVEHDQKSKYSKVTFTPNKDMINFGGVIQGGFLTAMMDDAMGYNCFVSMGMKNNQATIDIHTHFLSAVQMGPITVEAWVVKSGKSVAFLEAKLFDRNGVLAAKATSSTKLRPFTGLQFETNDERSDRETK